MTVIAVTIERIQQIARADGYIDTKVCNGKVYGLLRMMYTTALVAEVNATGYAYRYCFPNHADAVEAFSTWDGTGDPSGNWIKRKGRDGDFSNPNYRADE